MPFEANPVLASVQVALPESRLAIFLVRGLGKGSSAAVL
jgi:hypothetical protein